jgi:hypothetical protein
MPELPLYPNRTLVEGIAGTWHYHLSDKTKKTKALCGAEVMSTAIPETVWGYRNHLKERYCRKCAEIRLNSA